MGSPKIIPGILFSLLAGTAMMSSAHAHAVPPLKLGLALRARHLPLPLARHLKLKFGMTGVSTTDRANQLIAKTLGISAQRAGVLSLAKTGGGVITNGFLNGTIYENFGTNTFVSFGPMQLALGSNPLNTGAFGSLFNASTSTNYLLFHVPPPSAVIVASINGQHISSATSAVLSRYATISQAAFNQGRVGGGLSGGTFFGTFYVGTSPVTYTSTSNYFVAFGNNPLNNGSFNFDVTVPNQNGFLTFSNGITSGIKSGFLAATASSPILGRGPVGLPTGSNFLNVHAPLTYTFPSPPSSTLFF
jgi:hypothetical protein